MSQVNEIVFQEVSIKLGIAQGELARAEVYNKLLIEQNQELQEKLVELEEKFEELSEPSEDTEGEDYGDEEEGE